MTLYELIVCFQICIVAEERESIRMSIVISQCRLSLRIAPSEPLNARAILSENPTRRVAEARFLRRRRKIVPGRDKKVSEREELIIVITSIRKMRWHSLETYFDAVDV
jgi:hypothetical protein